MPGDSRMWAVTRTGGFAGFTVGMIARYEARRRTLPREAQGNLYETHLRQWARGVMRIYGVKPVVTGSIELHPPRARLVVANHRSPADILLVIALFGGRVLSRADLARWPFFGQIASYAGTIYVERGNRSSGAAAIRAIRGTLTKKVTVSLFPEGTTFEGDEVRPFRRGAFTACAGLDAEVVPVGIAYGPGAEFVNESFAAHLGRMAGRWETPVGVAIGAPIKTLGRRAADLAEEAQREVQTQTHLARRALEG